MGEVRNRGLELEAVANVTEALTLIGNVSFIDSEITEDATSSNVGNTPSQIADQLKPNRRLPFPKWSTRWVNYWVRVLVMLVILTLTIPRQTKVSSYTLFDTNIEHYRIEDYKFQVAAKNLADKSTSRRA
ncbi:TonB-dependent receptor [Vibrio lentus]|nr:TonB-dependent receptor [Vibrio lentus]